MAQDGHVKLCDLMTLERKEVQRWLWFQDYQSCHSKCPVMKLVRWLCSLPSVYIQLKGPPPCVLHHNEVLSPEPMTTFRYKPPTGSITMVDELGCRSLRVAPQDIIDTACRAQVMLTA